jgi:hypothetical protein
MENAAQTLAVNVFSSFGLIPLIGIPLAAAALALYGTIHFWPDEKAVSVAIAAFGIVFLIFAIQLYPQAQSACKNLYSTNKVEFNNDDCQKIVTCSAFGCT